jgi:uncharacterized RDD family membrane protein YckC
MNTSSTHPIRGGVVALFYGFTLLTFPVRADESLSEPIIAAPTVTLFPQDSSAMDTKSHKGRDLIRIGSTALLRENDFCGDAVVVCNTAIIRGRVKGDLVVVGGSAEVFNRIDGDLVIVGGTAVLSPQVRVGGDLVAVGAKISAPENIYVGGQRITIAPFLGTCFSSARFYMEQCLFQGRLISEHQPWTIVILFAFMSFGFLLSMLFWRTFTKAALVTSEKPGITLLIGLLTALAAGPLVVVLISTVIGIPAAPVFVLLLAGLAFIGMTGVYAAIGRQILAVFGVHSIPVAVPVLIGAGITMGLAMAPWIGAVTITLLFTFGVGAGVYSFFERIRENRPPKKPGTTDATSQPPLTNTIQPQAHAQARQTAVPPGAASAADYTLSPMPAAPLADVETSATMWSRLGGALIDMLLVFMVYGLTIGALIDHVHFGNEGGLRVFCLLVYLVVMWFWKGTTIGNIVFHLQVRRTDDTKLTLGVAVVRALGLVLSIAPLGLGFFWIRWDPNHQAWHDKIAGTKVVKVPKGVSLL